MCDHEWKHFKDIREPDFHVLYAVLDKCHKCGWWRFENLCDTRASGGVQRYYPPEAFDSEGMPTNV